MVLNFKVDDLNGMKRAELQKLCKSVGIKANMKVCDSSEIFLSKMSCFLFLNKGFQFEKLLVRNKSTKVRGM